MEYIMDFIDRVLKLYKEYPSTEKIINFGSEIYTVTYTKFGHLFILRIKRRGLSDGIIYVRNKDAGTKHSSKIANDSKYKCVMHIEMKHKEFTFDDKQYKIHCDDDERFSNSLIDSRIDLAYRCINAIKSTDIINFTIHLLDIESKVLNNVLKLFLEE